MRPFVWPQPRLTPLASFMIILCVCSVALSIAIRAEHEKHKKDYQIAKRMSVEVNATKRHQKFARTLISKHRSIAQR